MNLPACFLLGIDFFSLPATAAPGGPKWKTSSGLTGTPPATALRAIAGVAEWADSNKTGVLLV
jgi:hypothetical protein